VVRGVRVPDRVNMSAIGSVIVHEWFILPRRGFPGGDLAALVGYQLLLGDSGELAACAISRKHTRHRPNLR